MRKKGLSYGLLGAFMALAGCGDSKTLTLLYRDTVSSSPQFIVTVQSNSSSSFSQNQPAFRGSSGLVYYYGSNANYLKNCAVFTSQVDLNTSYNEGTPASGDCDSYKSFLTSSGIFPMTTAELKVGSNLNLSEDGYAYSLFFYNPTNSSTGTTANPGDVISSSNRCVKIWAARIQNKKLIQSGGVESSGSINLASLTCFGF